tara:strand:+ start:348 stop:611 length:264 start_codon:yes stop_codon:yes gene_type:complete
MRTQKPLPNPPEEYSKTYMFDLASLVIDEESVSCKTDRDNVLDKGSIVIRSPDGSYFKIVVANDGTLSASAVTTVDSRPVTSTNPYV